MIERAFGVLKKQFQILLLPTHYPLDIQTCISVVLCIIHNFIVQHEPIKDDNGEGGSGDTHGNEDNSEGKNNSDNSDNLDDGDENMNMRDQIARDMWKGYVSLQHAHEHECIRNQINVIEM